MGKYRSLGAMFNRVFRNDLNANFDDIEMDLTAQKSRVDNLIKGTPQPSEVTDARVDKLGKTSTTLKERLDKEQVNNNKKLVNLSDFSSVTDAISYAISNKSNGIFLDVPSASLHNVDFKGLEIVGNNTEITGSMKNVKKVSNVKIQGVDQDDKQRGDYGVNSGTVSTKIVHKINDNEMHVYSKKPYTDEFLDFKFEKGVFSTNSSAGAPADLLRLTGVNNLTEAYTQLTTPISSVGTWDLYTTNIQPASGIPNARNNPLKFQRNVSSSVGSIDFEVLADEYGVISLGFYCTPSGSENITLKFGSATLANFSGKSITGSSYFVIRKFQTNLKGNVTIRIEKTDSGYVYVCSNMFRLHEANLKANYDNVAFFDNGNGYITNSGALDYALVDENSLYWGSYHGGESLVSVKLLADGVNISSAGNNGKFFPCKKMSLNQTTQIGSYFSSRTSMVIGCDGIFDFSFALSGDANIRTIYTTMTTTKNEFNYVMYPKILNTSTDGEYYLGKTNRIVQENPTTNQRITTLFTQYDHENTDKGGVFVRVTSGAYNKVYYGPVVAGMRRITELYGSNSRIFE